MNPHPRTVEPKAAVVVMYRAPGRKIVGQGPPGAAAAIELKNAVEYLTQIHRAIPSARQGRWNQRLDLAPLLVREVRGIRRPCHASFIGYLRTSHTPSKLDFCPFFKAPNSGMPRENKGAHILPRSFDTPACFRGCFKTPMTVRMLR